MKKLIFSIVLVIPMLAHADLATEQDILQLTQSTMIQVDKKEYEKAIDVIRPHMPLPKHEIDALAYNIRQQAPTILERFGEPIGSELVCQQNIGTSLKRVTYVQKHEKHALLWLFDFYRPNEKWIVNAFTFHDNWQQLFEANCSNKGLNVDAAKSTARD